MPVRSRKLLHQTNQMPLHVRRRQNIQHESDRHSSVQGSWPVAVRQYQGPENRVARLLPSPFRYVL